jgi:hypothetical protein
VKSWASPGLSCLKTLLRDCIDAAAILKADREALQIGTKCDLIVAV